MLHIASFFERFLVTGFIKHFFLLFPFLRALIFFIRVEKIHEPIVKPGHPCSGVVAFPEAYDKHKPARRPVRVSEIDSSAAFAQVPAKSITPYKSVRAPQIGMPRSAF